MSKVGEGEEGNRKDEKDERQRKKSERNAEIIFGPNDAGPVENGGVEGRIWDSSWHFGVDCCDRPFAVIPLRSPS